MKYIAIMLLTLSLGAAALTSCSGKDAATNNGSDTGVSGTDNDVMGDIQRSGDDAADGTVFDTDNEYNNVDEYMGNGIGGSTYDGSGVDNNNSYNVNGNIGNGDLNANTAYPTDGTTSGNTMIY